MAEYATAVGFVQFPVNEREANGTPVRDVTIKTPGADGTLVRITVWDNFEDVLIDEGDFIAVDGKLNIREVDGTTYINMDANKLFVGESFLAPKGEREVVGKKPARKAF